jgi:hypothetical protein
VIILFTALELIVAHHVLVICVQSGVSAVESQGMTERGGGNFVKESGSVW